MLQLGNVRLKELHINPACLERLPFGLGLELTASASVSLFEDVRGAPVLASLELCEISSQDIIKTIPTLTQLINIKLEIIEIDEGTTCISSEVTRLEGMSLQGALMSPTAWTELFLVVAELPRLRYIMLGNINMGKFIPHFSPAMSKLERIYL
jgi:hypothetical protein